MIRLLTRIEKSKEFWFLLITSLLFFFLRFPSLFEPNWYGDEGIYQTIGLALRNGRLLYQGIWDNKPPLLYLVYGAVSGDQFATRLFSLIAGICTVIAFFFLAKKLFAKPRVAYSVTLLFAVLFGLPLLEGNIANAENFMLLPTILAGLLILKGTQHKILFLAGFLLSLAFLFKVVAVFDIAAFFVFFIFSQYTTLKKIFKLTPQVVSYGLGVLLPIAVTAVFFIFTHAFTDFLKASFVQNVGYVGYGNKLIIPQGFLILKLLLLAGFCLFLFSRRETINKQYLFTLLWFAFSLFNAFFSQRPYTHYVLVLLPSFCLLFGEVFSQKRRPVAATGIMLVTLLLLYKNFNFYGKTIYYYQNFFSFFTGTETTVSYQNFFDRNTPRDYNLSSYINRHKKTGDGLYIWGNNAEVYVLTHTLPPGRYTVAYHVTSYKDGYTETGSTLQKAKPRFIIIMPGQGTYPFFLSQYGKQVEIQSALLYERIF